MNVKWKLGLVLLVSVSATVRAEDKDRVLPVGLREII